MRTECFPPMTGNKARVSALIALFNNVLEFLGHMVR